MLHALQILAAVLVGLAAAMGLAHVLELPGKLRLSEEQYRAVQPIYYPGFTIGGFLGEFGGILATATLVAVTPSSRFWTTLGAFVALLAMHGVYWVMTHPVNKFWLASERVRGAGHAFFAIGAAPRAQGDWRDLRDQWEMSHVIRAALAFLALSLLLVAMWA